MIWKNSFVKYPLKLALEKKWVEVIETSSVNELELINHSNKTIFISAGDIVKGGKQDRTLVYDVVIAPNAKGEKLASFCVESARWEKRGNEDVAAPSSMPQNYNINQMNYQNVIPEQIRN